jgi:hypothetical protein
VIQADCLLHASAKREPKRTRRDSAVYEVCVMSVSNWPTERALRLEREKPNPKAPLAGCRREGVASLYVSRNQLELLRLLLPSNRWRM